MVDIVITNLAFALPITVVVVLLAIKTRKAIRGLWQRCENLQQQIQSHKIAWHTAQNGIYSSLATHIHGRAISFQSQHGEDVYLWNYFQHKTRGTCIEVGAFDGKTCSNTYVFETLGWDCILIEPDPDMATMASRNRPKSRVVHAAAGSREAMGAIEFHQVRTQESWSGMLSFTEADPLHLAKCKALGATIRSIKVPYVSLNSILEPIDGPIDFLSIDVEGHELEVLDGIDLAKYSPEIILTECTYDRQENHVEQYLKTRGYRMETVIGCNIVFIREEPVRSQSDTERVEKP